MQVYMFYRDMHCGFRAVEVHVFNAVSQSAGICHQHLQGCHFSGRGQISWPRELLEQKHCSGLGKFVNSLF